MDINNRSAGRGSINKLRTGLNIGMGVVYVVLGVLVLGMRVFGTIELHPTAAYVLGGVMILYGGFRVWRGITDIRNNNNYAE
jgi:threonine/homoserine/homoserine lactone efflux protein